MHRVCTTLILAVSVLVFAGFGDETCRRAQATGYDYQDHWPADLEGRQTALLFDRVPGYPSATEFNYRSDWPSTAAGRYGPETRYYVTYVNDNQGYGWNLEGHYHRSARYYQVGWQER